MSSPKTSETASVISLLRQAWWHTDKASNVIARARSQVWAKDVLEAFLIDAAEHLKKARDLIEQAAKLLCS
jgi:hypothetical protein